MIIKLSMVYTLNTIIIVGYLVLYAKMMFTSFLFQKDVGENCSIQQFLYNSTNFFFKGILAVALGLIWNSQKIMHIGIL